MFSYFIWLRITDEGSVPEMRIWSILLIKSVLKWCTHLNKIIFHIFLNVCTVDATYIVGIREVGPVGVVYRINIIASVVSFITSLAVA